MAEHNVLGREGERIARGYLEAKGMLILEANWRTGKLEIDLIGKEGEALVFVEVKTRRRELHGVPEAAVDRKKARRLISAASTYMDRIGHEGIIRFDVVSVLLPPGQKPRVRHITDAFFH
jgi:putative endonuclease